MGHGPCNATESHGPWAMQCDRIPWAMGHAMLYNMLHNPWVMGVRLLRNQWLMGNLLPVGDWLYNMYRGGLC